MKVLKMKKMPKGRYKITFDNGSDIVLYEEVIINNIIFIGKEIDKELQKNLNEENYKSSPYHQALQYISTRMRSREEVRTYLLKKDNDVALIDDALIKLEREGYIDDAAFARAYVHDKLNLSNDGLNKMRRALSNFNIKDDVIEQVLSTVDDQQLIDKADKLIAKQIRLNTKYTGNILKNRIVNYLVNLGYDSSLILERLAVTEFDNNGDIQKEYQRLYKKYANKYSGYKLDMTLKQHLYQKGYDASDIEKITK